MVPPDDGAKVAVTLRAAVMDTAQPVVPLQAPLQPLKLCPAAGVAVSATVVLR